jgi:hypothetical protein
MQAGVRVFANAGEGAQGLWSNTVTCTLILNPDLQAWTLWFSSASVVWGAIQSEGV